MKIKKLAGSLTRDKAEKKQAGGGGGAEGEWMEATRLKGGRRLRR